MIFDGFGSAIITDIKPEGQWGVISKPALVFLVRYQINEGANFIVPSGTTGGSPTLTPDEHEKVVAITVETADGKIPVMAGAGSNSTREAIRYTREAKAAGAKGVLIIEPYYNRPELEGLYKHYALIKEVGLPSYYYRIPSRTGLTDVPAEFILRLAEEEIIDGIKWAHNDDSQLAEILRHRPEGFAVFSGDDDKTLKYMKGFDDHIAGADGVISVLGNIAPRHMAQIVSLAKSGDWDNATAVNNGFAELMSAMFWKRNPIPVTGALHLLFPDLFNNFLRLPMTPLSPELMDKMNRLLLRYGFLNRLAAL